jgi:hypothetical protein
MVKVLVLALSLALVATSAHAATYYVRTGGGATTQCTGLANSDYPGSGSAQPCAYRNLQDAINVAAFGDTIKLAAGQTFSTTGPWASFYLPNKGTPPTRTDADYITITTDNPAGTPSVLSGYPANHVRITTAMATNMPKVQTVGSVPVFRFKNASKYWRVERLNITNLDTGTIAVALVGQDDPANLSDYPNNVIFQLNWLHPVEETGTLLSSSNIARTASNAFYLQATNLVLRQNAMQGFVGRYKYGGEIGARMTTSNILIGSWADKVLIENNLLEAWTYAFFSGGSGVANYLVTNGATVSSCTATSCFFSNTSGLTVGDPVAVYVGTASPPVWGATFVQSLSGGTVTFTSPLCHSYDGNNSCAPIGTVPANGNAARWDGYQPQNITARRNIFAHYPEWADLLDGDCGGKGYLEVKACVNCVFDGNTFTGCSGLTVTLRNQNGDFPWVSLDGLTFSNNYFKNSNNTFVAFLAAETPTHKSANVTWTNNLMVGVALNQYFPGGVLSGNFQGGTNVTITHNTVLWANNYRNFISFLPRPMTALTIRDNILGAAANICFTDFGGTSSTSVANCWPSALVDHNILLNTNQWQSSDINSWWLTPYPRNTVVSQVSDIGFTAPSAQLDATGNYRLLSSSPYRNAATDGTDVGVNYAKLIDALGYDPNAANSGGLGSSLGAPSNLKVQ